MSAETNPSPDAASFDVVIVGLGPVGATAAILFAEAGLRVAAVERDTEVYRLPRAVNLDAEIIRGMQRVDRAEAIDELMQKVRPEEQVGFTNSRHEMLFGTKMREFGANGWQPMNFFDQPELEGYLRTEALGQANVTAYVGYDAADLVDHGDRVEITATPAEGTPVRLAGRYLIGCDGATSSIRRHLGIEWTNLGYDQDWLVVDITAKEGNTLDTLTRQVCDPDRITTYVCTKDPYRRWEFRMNDGETAEQMLDEETIQSLIDAWTPRGTYDIRRAAVYQFHAATAASWRVGNVFIAGDAAHQTPPFLGQGMNAGMRDVVNLGWKLPLVISGVADDALLDTYEAERSPHASDLVEWAVAVGRLMEHLADVERTEREGREPPEQDDALRSSGYGQGREAPPIRGGAVTLEQVTHTGSTGYLFSQPIVRRADGTECRLDDLLGNGFAVVARSEADLDVGPDARAMLDHLGARTVSLDGLECARGHFDRLFDDHAAAVVRPDRVVFGHTDGSTSLDALIASLSTALHLNDPQEN